MVSLLGIGRTYQNIQTVHVHCKPYQPFAKVWIFCDRFLHKNDSSPRHCAVCASSTAKRGLITPLIVAIDGVAVFSQFDRCPTLIALFNTRKAPKTLVLPHFRRCRHPHFDFNWRWLFIGWFGGYCNDLADIVMARFVTQRCCHTALNGSVTLWALWLNLRLSTT